MDIERSSDHLGQVRQYVGRIVAKTDNQTELLKNVVKLYQTKFSSTDLDKIVAD